MSERQIVKEKTDWVERGVAAILFVSGVNYLATAATFSQAATGAAIIWSGLWMWQDSRRNVAVTV
ncbi:hypothetical protein HY404_03785 [Candidatus Microgenomates bacterium]|nr:hypothetical protein [Candidatus Microgenomates bacterium]